jgi:hypothetical protein
MSHRLAIVALLAGSALLALNNASLAQNAPPAAPVPPANNAPVPFQMTMGDMMNTLVQPRHAKLGLAGQAENWPLAGYAIREVQQAFQAISKSIPRWRGLPVPDLVEAAVAQPIKEVITAVKQQDAQRFAAAYGQLTQGCNACHATADHQFVVIKAPDASNFPNQDFGAKR